MRGSIPPPDTGTQLIIVGVLELRKGESMIKYVPVHKMVGNVFNVGVYAHPLEDFTVTFVYGDHPSAYIFSYGRFTSVYWDDAMEIVSRIGWRRQYETYETRYEVPTLEKVEWNIWEWIEQGVASSHGF